MTCCLACLSLTRVCVQVSVVAFGGEQCIAAVEDNPSIRKYLLSPPPFRHCSRRLFLLYAPVKVLVQVRKRRGCVAAVCLWERLGGCVCVYVWLCGCVAVRGCVWLCVCDHTCGQHRWPNDRCCNYCTSCSSSLAHPTTLCKTRLGAIQCDWRWCCGYCTNTATRISASIPTLVAVLYAALCRGSSVVIDWHNFGFTILALTLGDKHPVVKVGSWARGLVVRVSPDPPPRVADRATDLTRLRTVLRAACA